MKSFEWSNATSVDEAVKLLTLPQIDGPDPDSYEAPRPIAGGQDLLTTMKDYITRPSRVVNLKTIPDLNHIEGTAKTGLKIGALTTLTELEEHPEIAKNFPGLAEAAHSVATPQIRNLATIGGNLCQRPRCWYFRLENVICLKKGGSECYAAKGENKYHAILGGGPSYIVHPSDLAPMLIALHAVAAVTGPAGKREIALDKFFTTPKDGNLERENVLKDDEIITHISIPADAYGLRTTYLKFKERSSLDFALAAVAAAVELNPDQTIKRGRVVLGGVATIPWHVHKAGAYLTGKKIDDATLAEVAKICVAGAVPLSQNQYKIPLTQTLVKRALSQLATA